MLTLRSGLIVVRVRDVGRVFRSRHNPQAKAYSVEYFDHRVVWDRWSLVLTREQAEQDADACLRHLEAARARAGTAAPAAAPHDGGLLWSGHDSGAASGAGGEGGE